MQVIAVLRDTLPPRVLADMSYTGRFVAAAEAMGLGLINRVVPASQLEEAVDAVLADIRRASPQRCAVVAMHCVPWSPCLSRG